MMSEALALAILTTTGYVMLYQKFPKGVRQWIAKHHLFTDIVVLIGSYFLLGGTLTALFAGALIDIFTSVLLHIANHPDDFLFLYDARDFIKEQTNNLKKVVIEYGKEYRENKLTAQKVVDSQFEPVN